MEVSQRGCCSSRDCWRHQQHRVCSITRAGSRSGKAQHSGVCCCSSAAKNNVDAASTFASHSPAAMALPPFKLERYMSKWEFSSPYPLCCSDCEPLHMAELLQFADPDSGNRWRNLKLGYTESRGSPVLLQEIATMYRTIRAEDVLVCAPEEGIFLTMHSLLKPSDHVVAMFPAYQSLFQVAKSVGCDVTLWEPEMTRNAGIKFDVEQLKILRQVPIVVHRQYNDQLLRKLIRPNTKLVIINVPHNPTGCILTQGEWREVITACQACGAYLFSDEMYRGLEYDPDTRLPSCADLYNRGITLCGMSKTYSLPGLRIGWLACQDAAVLDRILEIKDFTTICSSAPSEVLALMGLRAREMIARRNLSTISLNIRMLRDFFNSKADIFEWQEPAAGSVAFPRIKTGEGIESFCEQALTKAGVLLIPATVYDHEPSIQRGHFRIGLGRRNMRESLKQFTTFLDSRLWQRQRKFSTI